MTVESRRGSRPRCDGFALAAAGRSQSFLAVGAAELSGLDLSRPLEEAVSHVLDGFPELDVHPDESRCSRSATGSMNGSVK